MRQLTTFTQTEEGLLIKLNPAYKEDIEEIREKFKDGEVSYYQAWWDLNEYNFCNGYRDVEPRDIGALTSAPIISDELFDDETTQEEADAANIWVFFDYAIRSELDELFEEGEVLFPIHQKSGE